MAFRDEQLLFSQARRAVQHHRAWPGVDDITWGTAFTNRQATDRLAIRFNVKQKKPRARLSQSELIPSSINGFSTDVTEFRFNLQVRDEPAYDRVRPLMGGVQVQSGLFSGPREWGTLGCQLLFNGQRYGISNEHVLVDSYVNTVIDSVSVYQPKRATFGETIGRLSPVGDAKLDFRLVELSELWDSSQSINQLPGIVDGYILAAGMNELRLAKSGAGSGWTEGIYDGRSLLYPHRVMIRAVNAEPVSLPGDSGSMWVVREGAGVKMKLFALHTGGEEEGRIAVATLYSSIHSSIHAQLRMAGKRNIL